MLGGMHMVLETGLNQNAGFKFPQMLGKFRSRSSRHSSGTSSARDAPEAQTQTSSHFGSRVQLLGSDFAVLYHHESFMMHYGVLSRKMHDHVGVA